MQSNYFQCVLYRIAYNFRGGGGENSCFLYFNTAWRHERWSTNILTTNEATLTIFLYLCWTTIYFDPRKSPGICIYLTKLLNTVNRYPGVYLTQLTHMHANMSNNILFYSTVTATCIHVHMYMHVCPDMHMWWVFIEFWSLRVYHSTAHNYLYSVMEGDHEWVCLVSGKGGIWGVANTLLLVWAFAGCARVISKIAN